MQQKKTDLKDTLSRILKEIRLQRGWSQADLAAFLGVTTAAVGNWESKANGATTRRLKIISEKLGLPVESFYSSDGVENVRSRAVTPSRTVFALRAVPVVSWARAGEAHDYADLCEQLEDQVETDSRDPNSFALIIEGDSMEPEFIAGDIVVFAPNSEPRTGDFVVSRLKESHGVLFKRFRRHGPEGKKIRLESTNPNYPPLEIDVAEFRFIYPAISLKRRVRH